jgi:hypothetical protein
MIPGRFYKEGINRYYKSIEKEQVKESAPDTDSSKRNSMLQLREEESARSNPAAYGNFLESVRVKLLKETFESLYAMVVSNKYYISEEAKTYALSCIDSYIKENTSSAIISKIKKANTLFNCALAEAIEESFAIITEKVDKNNPKSFNISDDDITGFYDKIDSDTFTDASDLIRARVSAATEEFIMGNKRQSEEINTIVTDTKEKVDAVLSTNTDPEVTRESVEKQFMPYYTRRVNSIKDNRRRNILEEMIYRTSNKVLKDEALMEAFSENNNISMDKIVEHVEVAYTIMEILNTLKIDELNENSLESLLQEI